MPTTQNVESSQKRISPKNAQGGEKPCHRHLQKSFSDGKLVEDENNTEISAPNTQANKPHKAVKFLQTLPQPQLPISAGINPSEDEVSDRDLPELAPIDIQDYHRKSKHLFI